MPAERCVVHTTSCSASSKLRAAGASQVCSTPQRAASSVSSSIAQGVQTTGQVHYPAGLQRGYIASQSELESCQQRLKGYSTPQHAALSLSSSVVCVCVQAGVLRGLLQIHSTVHSVWCRLCCPAILNDCTLLLLLSSALLRAAH